MTTRRADYCIHDRLLEEPTVSSTRPGLPRSGFHFWNPARPAIVHRVGLCRTRPGDTSFSCLGSPSGIARPSDLRARSLYQWPSWHGWGSNEILSRNHAFSNCFLVGRTGCNGRGEDTAAPVRVLGVDTLPANLSGIHDRRRGRRRLIKITRVSDAHHRNGIRKVL